MTVDVRSRSVATVHLDFDLSVEFDDGSVMAFSEVTVGATLFDEDNQVEGLRALASYVGAVCVGSDVSPSGDMTLRFADNAPLSAAPRDNVESWEYTAPDGSTVICLPGGEIDTADAPAPLAATRTSGGPITTGATAVRLSVGAESGVEFSDGSALHMTVPLHEAYLILRESVEETAVSADTVSVRLSSGLRLRASVA